MVEELLHEKEYKLAEGGQQFPASSDLEHREREPSHVEADRVLGTLQER